jgi:hypothetical protein
MKNITIGTRVVMPEPENDDFWIIGDFVGKVVNIMDNGLSIVEDQDSDFWTIETERLEVAEDDDE